MNSGMKRRPGNALLAVPAPQVGGRVISSLRIDAAEIQCVHQFRAKREKHSPRGIPNAVSIHETLSL